MTMTLALAEAQPPYYLPDDYSLAVGEKTTLMGKTVLVAGGGAREHALAWKLSQSPHIESLLCAPGNPGTAAIAENLAIDALDIEAMASLAKSRAVDLVVVGPEAPLAAGLADRVLDMGIAVCGPTQKAAQIESSKTWAKSIMERAGVPTARSITVDSERGLSTALDQFRPPFVIKADGLAAGKGVIIAATYDEALQAGTGLLNGSLLGQASGALVVEEFLEGQEVSMIALIDSTTTLPLLPACDYKRAFDGDEGPNTGGMGGFGPVPEVTPQVADLIQTTILEPTVAAMRDAGAPMKGILYAGLMMTADGPKVIEFNARFGDPEAEILLPLLESDLLELLMATANGTLASIEPLRWSDARAVCVVLASGGYPGGYPTGLSITGIGSDTSDSIVFHAGTRRSADGDLVTSGGRVLAVVGLGDTFEAASSRAYQRAGHITFEGKQHRTDIAERVMRMP